jgi:hypothetical protein
MDLFLVMDLGYRLVRGSVAAPPEPWETVIAVYPRVGHIADTVLNSLPYDDRRAIHAPLPIVLGKINDEMLSPAAWGTHPPEKGPADCEVGRQPRRKRKRSPAATPQRVVRVGRSPMKAGD